MKNITCQNYIDGMKKLQTSSSDFSEQLSSGKKVRRLYEIKDDIQETLDFLDPHQLALRKELAERLGLKLVNDFYDGWAQAIEEDGRRHVFINEDGKFLSDSTGTRYEFVEADRFSDGLAAIKIEQDGEVRCGYVDIDGNIRSWRVDFPDTICNSRFCMGLAMVKEASDRIYIGLDGSEADLCYKRQLFNAQPFAADGFAKALCNVTSRGGSTVMTEFYDKRGGLLSTEDSHQYFLSATNFSEGLAAVQTLDDDRNKIWHFIDKHGKYCRNKNGQTLEFDYNEVSERHDGFFKFHGIHLPSYYRYFNPEDPSGKYLEDEEGRISFDAAYDFSEGTALVGLNFDGQMIYRYLQKNGKYLRYPDGKIMEFDWAQPFDDGLASVQDLTNNKFVFIDHRGKVIFE